MCILKFFILIITIQVLVKLLSCFLKIKAVYRFFEAKRVKFGKIYADVPIKLKFFMLLALVKLKILNLFCYLVFYL